jgi:23S rRNA (uracil1939-C5)-methyltransferase
MSILELRIDSIAAGGDGVGRYEGMVVFVPRTAPGDVVRVDAVRRDRLMRGRLLDVLSPSPARTEPQCRHYVRDRCGGCQLQHVEYTAQLSAKSVIIRDAITRIGKVERDAPSVEASDKPWRYRRKLTLALRRRGDAWIAGLHRFDAPGEIFALEDCPITDERVLTVWSTVMRHQHHLPRAPELRGAVRALTSGFAFTLEGGRTWRAHAEFFGAVREMTELWWAPEGTDRRLLHSRHGDEAGASFVQVNPGVTERLRQWVFSLAAALRPTTAVDAYAGSGDIAVGLATQGTQVTAIEIDADAARVASSRLPSGSLAVAAPVEKALRHALPADLVVLNPPRAGVDDEVTRLLSGATEKPKAIVYVSCNPATLARDIGRLAGYEIRSLRGFDMFPQTAHVETVCELVPTALS